MNEMRGRRLELALRRNRGTQIRPGWLAAIRAACHVDVSEEDLLPLEETEDLKHAFFVALKERCSYLEHWPASALTEIATLLSIMAADVGSLPIVLFSSVDQYIGALQLPASAVLENSLATWRVVEEDLRFATIDMKSGLCLEFNDYTEIGERIVRDMYELGSWGNFVPKAENRL